VKTAGFSLAAWVIGLALVCNPAPASSGSGPVISYFPQHCSEVAHVDLAQARQFPWFVALKTKFIPLQFYRLEKFINSPKFGLGNQIDAVDWAVVKSDAASPGGVLGIATGEFDRQTAESELDSLKPPAVEYEGQILYATASDFGGADLLITFLDSDTVAFGSRGLLEQAIRVRSGAEPGILQDSKMLDLIRQQNNDGIFWSISTADAARAAFRRMSPPAGGIPILDRSVAAISSLVVSGEGSSGTELDVSLVAATATPQNALDLANLVQAGLALKQFQIGQVNPDFAKILGDLRSSANNNQLAITLTLKNNDVATLIQNDELLIPAM
jgi:hypothetical protein